MRVLLLALFSILFDQPTLFPHAEPIIGQKVELIEKNEYQFVVRIAKKNSQIVSEKFLCSGGLISSKHVMTAAECIENELPQNMQVITSNGQEWSNSWSSDVSSIKTFKNWSQENNLIGNGDDACHDLAILELANIVSGIQPAAISVNVNDLQPGSRVTVTGWGRFLKDTRVGFPRNPRKISMTIMKEKHCLKEIKGLKKDPLKEEIPAELICAISRPYPAVVTAGDRGGPVIIGKDSIVAITLQRCPYLGAGVVDQHQVNLLLRLNSFVDFIRSATDHYATYTN